MSDYNSSLPVRTENNGDVVAKIADATLPSQQLKVNADGSINVTDNGASLTVDATDLDIRDLDASQDNVAISDGVDTLEINSDGSINAVVTALGLDIRNLSATQDNVAISDGADTLDINSDGSINAVVTAVTATDIDIRDLTSASDSVAADIRVGGNAVSVSNPVPVSISANIAGTEINDYNTAASVAANASSNHDYLAVGEFLLTQISASASGKMKIEVRVETAPGSNVFNTRFVQFNSTSNPNIDISLKSPISVPAGARVRVVRTNRDNQPQDLYSTISGQEP
jgi:hypothetical protein